MKVTYFNKKYLKDTVIKNRRIYLFLPLFLPQG